MTYKLFAAPGSEPVSLEEAKLHLRETGTDQDALITSLIKVAREYVEDFTRRALITQTWDLYLDEFEAQIAVYHPPLQSIVHIEYANNQGVTQTMTASDYQLDAKSEPGRITPPYGECWPSTQQILNAVNVRFVAGYADADAVPEKLKQAMKLIIAHLYEHRESVSEGTVIEVPMGVKALLGPYVMKGFY